MCKRKCVAYGGEVFKTSRSTRTFQRKIPAMAVAKVTSQSPHFQISRQRKVSILVSNSRELTHNSLLSPNAIQALAFNELARAHFAKIRPKSVQKNCAEKKHSFVILGLRTQRVGLGGNFDLQHRNLRDLRAFYGGDVFKTSRSTRPLQLSTM